MGCHHPLPTNHQCLYYLLYAIIVIIIIINAIEEWTKNFKSNWWMSVDVLFHQIVTNLWRDTPHTHTLMIMMMMTSGSISEMQYIFFFVLSYLQLQPTNQSGYRTPNRTETPIHVLMMPVEILGKCFIEYLHHWTKSGSHSHQVKCWDKPFRAYMTLLNILQPSLFLYDRIQTQKQIKGHTSCQYQF